MPQDISSKASELSKIFLDANLPGLQHRIDLVKFLGITPGSRVLEIGCGQGDCTTVLADAVGEQGHVDAVDPGPPEYGSPYTLGQCQSHLLAGPLGSRISFHNVDPVDYLQSLSSSTPPYDFIIMCHCIWYFPSPATLSDIVTACIGKARKLCLAEWSLVASSVETLPHVITALLLASIEAKRKTPSNQNIRTILSPGQIVRNIAEVGPHFRFVKEETANSGDSLDGQWEVGYLIGARNKLLQTMKDDGVSEQEISALVAMFDSVKKGVDGLGGYKKVRTMDWWGGVWESD
jgi:SAM-dependent methyltransferase